MVDGSGNNSEFNTVPPSYVYDEGTSSQGAITTSGNANAKVTAEAKHQRYYEINESTGNSSSNNSSGSYTSISNSGISIVVFRDSNGNNVFDSYSLGFYNISFTDGNGNSISENNVELFNDVDENDNDLRSIEMSTSSLVNENSSFTNLVLSS